MAVKILVLSLFVCFPHCFFETGSHYVAHAVLELTRHTKKDPAALASQVRGLKACTTFPASVIYPDILEKKIVVSAFRSHPDSILQETMQNLETLLRNLDLYFLYCRFVPLSKASWKI